MTVRSVLNPNVATIDGDSDIRRAAELMRHEHVGDLVVTDLVEDRTQPIGILTDRDIVVEVVASGVHPSSVRAADIVTRDLVTVREDNGLAFALTAMRRAGVRRAPVINDAGALVGILALDDVVDHLASQLGEVAATIRGQRFDEARQVP